MRKKIKTAVLMLMIYALVFYIGFKSGAMNVRMKNKLQIEKIVVAPPPAPPATPLFYIVEKQNYGNYSTTIFREVTSGDIILKLFMNEKLRPLLELTDVHIYKDTGERIY